MPLERRFTLDTLQQMNDFAQRVALEDRSRRSFVAKVQVCRGHGAHHQRPTSVAPPAPVAALPHDVLVYASFNDRLRAAKQRDRWWDPDSASSKDSTRSAKPFNLVDRTKMLARLTEQAKVPLHTTKPSSVVGAKASPRSLTSWGRPSTLVDDGEGKLSIASPSRSQRSESMRALQSRVDALGQLVIAQQATTSSVLERMTEMQDAVRSLKDLLLAAKSPSTNPVETK